MNLILLVLAILYLCGYNTGIALAIGFIVSRILRAVIKTWKEMK